MIYVEAVKVILDTSALTALLNCAGRRSKFEEFAKEKALRVIIPSAALDELFVIDNPAVLAATACGLVALHLSLGLQFDFAAPHREVWNAEFSHKLDALPLIPARQRAKLISMLTNTVNEPESSRLMSFAPVRTAIKRWKATRAVDGKSIRAEEQQLRTVSAIDPDQLKAELQNFSAATAPDWLLQTILQKTCGAGLGSATAVLTADGRCPALKTWLGLAYLSMLAETLPRGFGNGDPFFDVLKRDRNDFFDAALTSLAAYCDQFVSRDTTLIKRCSLLQHAGWVKFTALHLEEDLHL